MEEFGMVMRKEDIEEFEAESPLSLMPGIQTQVDGLAIEFQEITSPTHNLTEDPINRLQENETTVIQLMDIRTKLSELSTELEKRLNVSLKEYEFWLQDTKLLEKHKTLVDQCIRGEGLVQVNIQIKHSTKRINVMDVLKPDERFVENENVLTPRDASSVDDGSLSEADLDEDEDEENVDDLPEETGNTLPATVKWKMDTGYVAHQARLNIPNDPFFWTVPQVSYWIQWAVRQFKLTNVKLSDWNISGSQLCVMTPEEFKKKCPEDPLGLFWMHIELLKTCKFAAVLQNEEDLNAALGELAEKGRQQRSDDSQPLRKKAKTAETDSSRLYLPYAKGASNGSGQVQLWQFLLELLTSAEHTHIIQWIGNNGEFKLQDPECVARLWGERKHKPAMNYEKLSRALRYYYDGDMIAKVQNKRFVYRFVCDLKELIGYDASELSRLVNSARGDRPQPPETW